MLYTGESSSFEKYALWLLWRPRSVWIEESGEDSPCLGGRLYDCGLKSPFRLLTLVTEVAQWFPGRSWYIPPSSCLSWDCFPRFQPLLFRTAAHLFMIEVSDREVFGLGSAFSVFSPVCIRISPPACPSSQRLLWQACVLFPQTARKVLLVSGFSHGSHVEKCQCHADVPSCKSRHQFPPSSTLGTSSSDFKSFYWLLCGRSSV